MEISRKKILNKEYRTYVKKNPNQEQNFRQIFEEMKSRNKKIDLKIYESLKNSLRDTEEEIGKIKQSNKKFKEKIEELSTKYHGTLMPSPPKENKGEILFEEEKISQKKSLIFKSYNKF